MWQPPWNWHECYVECSCPFRTVLLQQKEYIKEYIYLKKIAEISYVRNQQIWWKFVACSHWNLFTMRPRESKGRGGCVILLGVIRCSQKKACSPGAVLVTQFVNQLCFMCMFRHQNPHLTRWLTLLLVNSVGRSSRKLSFVSLPDACVISYNIAFSFLIFLRLDYLCHLTFT